MVCCDEPNFLPRKCCRFQAANSCRMPVPKMTNLKGCSLDLIASGRAAVAPGSHHQPPPNDRNDWLCGTSVSIVGSSFSRSLRTIYSSTFSVAGSFCRLVILRSSVVPAWSRAGHLGLGISLAAYRTPGDGVAHWRREVDDVRHLHLPVLA